MLELQHAALAEGRPRQQQSPAIYCGGLCWWAVSEPPLLALLINASVPQRANVRSMLSVLHAASRCFAVNAASPHLLCRLTHPPPHCLYSCLQVLVANPRHDRFELYASCAAFSLFQEPFRAALQPAAGACGWRLGCRCTRVRHRTQHDV